MSGPRRDQCSYDDLVTLPAGLPEHARPVSAGTGRTGILLVHGFTGSPASLRPTALALAAEGFRVELPLLPGHGTRWEDLEATSWTDWYAGAERAYLRLAEQTDHVAVLALSMGGSLALRLAAHHPVSSLVLVNPSVRTRDRRFWFMPVLSRGVRSLAAIGDDIAKEGVTEHAYDRTPLRSVAELTRLWAAVRKDLPQVTCPLLLLRSRTDHVVDPSSAELILSSVSSAETREVVLERSHHVATLDHDAPLIVAEAADFVRAHGA